MLRVLLLKNEWNSVDGPIVNIRDISDANCGTPKVIEFVEAKSFPVHSVRT